jgi:sortase A
MTMSDLAQDLARLIDEMAEPVSADEARSRALRRRRRRAAFVSLTFAAIVAAGVGAVVVHSSNRHDAVHVSQETNTTMANTSHPVPGHSIGVLQIDSIGVRVDVREGIALDVLRQGPGHDPSTPLPGAPGNVVIEGHRTTYTAPFLRLDELRPGDLIKITTKTGEHDYVITTTRVIEPAALNATIHDPGPSLTLVTNDPKYFATRRLVVTARAAAR